MAVTANDQVIEQPSAERCQGEHDMSWANRDALYMPLPDGARGVPCSHVVYTAGGNRSYCGALVIYSGEEVTYASSCCGDAAHHGTAPVLGLD